MSDEKSVLKELFCEMAKKRDFHIELKEDTTNPELASYFEGMATAFDMVRGMIFQAVGEEDWIK